MYSLLKKILFSLDAEEAHELTLKIAHRFPMFGQVLGNCFDPKFQLSVGKNNWSFPIGLAAGLDKNAVAVDFFSNLGFGAIEVGTVTPRAQIGNERPRLFRYIDEESIRNCMGFNNQGLDELKLNLKKIKNKEAILGVNIGKNKSTPDQLAFQDYSLLYSELKKSCNYIVINVSSPNTPGLREHQTKEGLEQIISNLNYKNEVDLFVKIAPDISLDSVVDVCELVKKYKLTGIVATNTTIMAERGIGGVSGKLLFEKSNQIRRKCLEVLKETPSLELIGVGGFSDFSEMRDYWRSGGRAVQIYSSFIYQGPKILNNLRAKLVCEFDYFGVTNFEEYLKILRESK